MQTRWLLSLTLCACSNVVALPEGGETSSGEPSESSGTGIDDPVASTGPHTTGDPASTTFGSTTGEGTGGSTGGDETCGGFLCPPTDSSDGIECSIWEQDCPVGEKCSPYANDGGAAWNDLRCVPIDPNPDDVGEPCTVEGSGVTGIDSCVLGAMCFDVGPDNTGVCTPHCTGSPKAPTCADPDRFCRISSEGALTLCLEQCDPLDPDACAEGQGCYSLDDRFTCMPDGSGKGGAAFEACEFTNACDPGLACINAAVVEICEPGSLNCCSPFCDLLAPDCPDPLGCFPYFEAGEAPPAYEFLGVCLGSAP